jgi:hypothetical protein
MPLPPLSSFVGAPAKPGGSPLNSFVSRPPAVAPAPVATPAPYNPPLVQLVNKVAGYFGNSIGSAATAGIDQIKQGASDITSGKETPIEGAESGLSVESGIASLISSPLAPLLKPLGSAIKGAGSVGDALAYLSTKVGLMTTAQKAAYDAANAKFANSPTGNAVTRVATDTENAGNVSGTILGADQAVKAVPGAVKTVAKIPAAIDKSLTPPASAVSIADAHITAVAKDWEAPSKVNSAAYSKARGVLAKAPDTPTVLAKAGINPFAHVVDGKYETAETADALRETANKISTDVVRPSLHQADYTAPKTPATDLADAAKLQVESLPGVTAGDAAKIKGSIDTEIDALKQKYPEGMSLTNLHDEKINYSQNSGYNQFKSNADTNTALANKAISLTLKDAVEAGVPKDAPIKETNAYLSKLYSGADYLEALDGKKAPATTGQSVARFAAKFGGAALARHFTPGLGELVSSFAGYQIGKAVENVLENMTNAGRAEFLSNMQRTNPEVVTKLQAYLGSAPK